MTNQSIDIDEALPTAIGLGSKFASIFVEPMIAMFAREAVLGKQPTSFLMMRAVQEAQTDFFNQLASDDGLSVKVKTATIEAAMGMAQNPENFLRELFYQHPIGQDVRQKHTDIKVAYLTGKAQKKTELGANPSAEEVDQLVGNLNLGSTTSSKIRESGPRLSPTEMQIFLDSVVRMVASMAQDLNKRALQNVSNLHRDHSMGSEGVIATTQTGGLEMKVGERRMKNDPQKTSVGPG